MKLVAVTRSLLVDGAERNVKRPVLKGPFLTLGAMKGPFSTLGVTKGPFGASGAAPLAN